MSVIMRTHQQYCEDISLLYQNLQSCNCCPYGYHIDLDFVRYCESLVNAKPSDGQLLRRDKRRSRKSIEVMLGLENFYQWEPADKVHRVEEVHVEIEPESPRVVHKIHDYSCYTSHGDSLRPVTTPTTTNSSPETSAFLHDALDEVVSDFERTLERTKKKSKQNNNNNKNNNDNNNINIYNNNRVWGLCFDRIDSCVSGNKSQSRKDEYSPPTLEKEEEVESIGSNGSSDKSTNALHNIREQMAISLTRMKDLEEQVKDIPLLQKQLTMLREEKRQLQLQLRKDEPTITKPTTATSGVSSPKLVHLSFTPQRISPVALESMGSRIRSNSQSEPTKKILKRDIGITCIQHTRDVGTLASPMMVHNIRSVGTNPVNTNGIHDDLFTKRELNDIIKTSLEDYEIKKENQKQNNLISIGTQMVSNVQPEKKHICIQTIPEKVITKVSQSVMVCPSKRDAYISCKPETRTIGSSDNKITDKICDKCSITKRTIGCGPDSDETKSYLSLKSMDMPPRSLSFSLGETEKINIKRKTIGTQYKISVKHIGIQKCVSMESIGIQNTVNLVTKSCQHLSDNVAKQTDTIDLIRLIDCDTNTDDFKVKNPEVITCDNYSNTELSRTKNFGSNTLPPVQTKHSSSNTELVHKKDVGCGEIIKPHITIACADNYCDSCKDAIKSLAREFSKVLGSPILSGEHSRIPRPTSLTSPRPGRKKFMRQHTYTIATTPSPSPELRTISEISTKTPASSLDLVNRIEQSPTGKRKNGEVHSDNDDNRKFHLRNLNKESISSDIIVSPGAASIPADDSSSTGETVFERKIYELRRSSWQNLDLEKQKDIELVNGDDVSNKLDYTETASSHHLQNMLLNQIATSETVPRTKVTPSKEMRAAMKVINDSLQKNNSKSNNLKNANAIVQKEWFKISSTDHANPLDVEDYLDCFEEFSNSVLRHVVNMADNNGNTAMHYAVSHGNFDVVSILLDSKVCDVNQTNNAGYTCVMLVSLAKLKNSAHRTVVQRLFQMADVNIRAKKHCQTALMLAVSHGNFDMVEMLLHAGADINIQDEDGSTALMCAAEHGRIDIVKHLLSQQDCDSLIQDVDGSTAFKIAWQAGHRDIGLLLYVHEQMLRSKMPNRSEPRSASLSRQQQKSQ